MAKIVVVEIKTKGVNKASKEIENVSKSLDDVASSSSDAAKSSKDLGEGLKTAGKKGKKGLKAVEIGFKGIGLAIKAAGIGLIIGLFAALKEVLEKQQPVIDLVDTTFTAIGLAITEVSDALAAAFASTSDATGGFDALAIVAINMVKIALTPIQVIFQLIKGAIIDAQLRWEKSFFGDGDPETIKELEDALSKVGDELIDLGKSAFESGKLIAENFTEAVSEVVEFTKAASKELAKINISSILSEASRITELKKNALIQAAINKGLLESFDRLAEQQRQIRDDDTKTIEERIKANKKLGEILEEQEKVMIKNAKIVTAAAEAEFKANKTTENRVKLIEAQNEELAILATVEGFRSEQLINQIGLERELQEVTEERVTAGLKIISETLKTQQEIEIQAIKDLTAAKILALEESGLEITETKARLQQEENDAIKEVNDLARDSEINEKLKAAQNSIKIAHNLTKSLENISQSLATITNNRLAAEESRLAKKAENEIKLNGEVSSSTLLSQKKLEVEKNKSLKRQFDIAKAFNIATVIMTTATAVISALAPPPVGLGPLLGPILAIVTGIAGVAQVAAIASQKFTPSSVGGGGGGGSIAATIPSTPTQSASTPAIAGGAQFTQQELFGAETELVGGGAGILQTTKVVVLEADITETQSKVNVLEDTASFGE